MPRRSMVANTGLYLATPPVALLGGTGGTTAPPPGDYPWRPFSATTSPWNVEIVWSGATTASLGTSLSQLWGGTGHAWVSNEQAGAFIFHEDGGSIPWAIFDARNNRTVSVRAPSNFGPANNSTDYNAQLFTTSGVAWDFYQLTINGSGSASCAGAQSTSLSGIGVGTGLYPNGTKAGFRASGFPWSAGCITLADWQNQVIPHALVVALGAGLQSPPVYPAVSQDSGGYSGGSLPQGRLMGIPPWVTKPSGMSTIGSLAWDAAAKYGIYVGDRTGGWSFVGDFGPQSPLPGSVVDPLRYAPFDGDKIVAALVAVTHGKPSIPNHA